MTYTYQLTQGTTILRSDGASIPADPRNGDYQAFLRWRDGWTEILLDESTVVHAPNTPLPAAPVPIPVPVVTMKQARLALLNAGLYPTVVAAVAALTGTAGQAAQITWEFASEVKRDDPLIVSMSAALNLTSAQVDALFVAAALL